MALCLRLQDNENNIRTMHYDYDDNDDAKNDVCNYDDDHHQNYDNNNDDDYEWRSV